MDEDVRASVLKAVDEEDLSRLFLLNS